MLKEIKKFIKKCPLLKGGKVNINYLAENPMHYSIEAVPCRPVIKEYVDGGSLRQYIFVFASREVYTEHELENIKTAEFYDDFGAWLEECSRAGELPEIPADVGKSLRLEVLSYGYAYDTDERSARFQMQCRLIYKRK